MMLYRKLIVLLLLLFASAVIAEPIGTSFTYQGELQLVEPSGSTAPANGEFDFTFRLFTAETSGTDIGTPIIVNNVLVTDGHFSVLMDFGIEPYSGEQLWLQIEVRNATDNGAFAALFPRQAITATPFANLTEFVSEGAVGESEVLSAEVQLRVDDSCPGGTVIISINEGGSINCANDNDAQTLSLNAAALSISDGNTIDLTALSGDGDTNNELNTEVLFDGTILTVSDAGGNQSADLSGLVNNDDNELNTNIGFDGSHLHVTDAGGSQSADLSELVNNDNNELNTGINLDGTTLTVSDAGGDQSATLTGANNDNNELNTGFALSGNIISITDASGNQSADLSGFLDNTDAQTLGLNGSSLSISSGNAVDLAALLGDNDPVNEINTNLNFDGTNLSVTDAGGTLNVDLSGLNDTAAQLLTKVITVDGADSGLEADLLDGLQANDIIAVIGQDNRIPISELPFTINDPGSYYVTDDLVNTTEDTNGININADNVTVDLGGFRLTSDMDPPTGVGISGRAGILIISQNNVHVRNGHIADWEASGISASTCDSCIFEGLSINNTSIGLRTGDYSLVNQVTASFNRSAGILLGEGSVVVNSTAQGNNGVGISGDGSSVIINCVAYENTSNGFNISASTIIASTAYGNSLNGFRIGTAGTVQQSSSYDNGENGFVILNAHARDNIAAGNGSLGTSTDTNNGFSVTSNSYLTNNMAVNNDGSGIQVRFSDNTVENNIVIDNDRNGIEGVAQTSSLGGSLIIGNRASGNGTGALVVNYVIGTGHAAGPIIDIGGVGDISAVTNADHPLANYEY